MRGRFYERFRRETGTAQLQALEDTTNQLPAMPAHFAAQIVAFCYHALCMSETTSLNTTGAKEQWPIYLAVQRGTKPAHLR